LSEAGRFFAQYDLRLTLTPGLGRASALSLLRAFGSAQGLFSAHTDQLVSVVGMKKAKALAQVPAQLESHLKATQQWLQASTQHHLITWDDSCYPDTLRQVDDAPVLLFAQGNLDLLNKRRALAIVGSRSPTPQGAKDAFAFAQTLTQQGWVIVSGLASGIDTAAHEGALVAQGETIAVVGTGLDRVFPTQNKALAERIAQHGLVLSEYLLGTPPLAAHFPQRNRLIAGLAVGTLVVEAALKSGSLITARLALEQGKEVFAIPGSIHSPIAKGCHQLIKQGAKLVESAEDILEELQAYKTPMSVRSFQSTRSEDQAARVPPSAFSDSPLLAALGHQMMSLDELQGITGWDAAHLQIQLLELELQNRVARVPGGLFQQIAEV
jgi:DNA processing protein